MYTHSPQDSYVFSTIQGQINNLASAYGAFNAMVEFDSSRHNHINLDIPNEANSDDEVLTSRIFPKRQLQVAEPVFVDADVVRDRVFNILRLVWKQFQSALEIVSKLMLLVDAQCERVFTTLRVRITTAYDLVQTKSGVSENTTMATGSVYTFEVAIPVQEQVREVIHHVSEKASKEEDSKVKQLDMIETPRKRNVVHQKSGVFLHTLKLVYEELAYGNRLRDIDRV